MHEWALAEAVLNSAQDYCKKNRIKKPVKATVLLGELQQIDRKIFLLALKEIIQERKLDWIKPVIKKEKALFECRKCGFKWSFDELKLREAEQEFIHFLPEASHSYLECPECNSPDFKVVKGRGVSIIGVKGV